MAVSGWGYSQVPGLGCRYGCGIGYGSQARDLHLNLKTRTRDPMAETWDPKVPSPATRIAPVMLPTFALLHLCTASLPRCRPLCPPPAT